MIQEIKDQLPCSQKPGCVVASVGGGGLLTGKFPGKNDSQVGSSPLKDTSETLGGHLHFIWDTHNKSLVFDSSYTFHQTNFSDGQ